MSPLLQKIVGVCAVISTLALVTIAIGVFVHGGGGNRHALRGGFAPQRMALGAQSQSGGQAGGYQLFGQGTGGRAQGGFSRGGGGQTSGGGVQGAFGQRSGGRVTTAKPLSAQPPSGAGAAPASPSMP